MRSEPDHPLMTLDNAAAAHVRFMVWCKACGYRSEPDPGEQARAGMDRRRQFPSGALGWCARSAAAAMSTWW